MESQYDMYGHQQHEPGSNGTQAFAAPTRAGHFSGSTIMSADVDPQTASSPANDDYNFDGLRGTLKLHERLARYTSWQVGGPADRLYRPADLADLSNFLRQLPKDEPLLWVGLGSNLLIRDGGFRGTVIVTKGVLNEFERDGELEIVAGAGFSCAQLARRVAACNMTGGEFFCGIPGTVGGALAMNAGAYGVETWERVLQVRTIDRQGELHTRTPEEYAIGYRSVAGLDESQQHEWFISARLQFETDPDGGADKRITELLRRRADAQPLGERSCGSVFRNPPGRHAWQVVDSLGLRGTKIGGAQISEKHSNFIINAAEARAADIEAMISHIRNTAAMKLAIDLIPEVRVAGDELPAKGVDA